MKIKRCLLAAVVTLAAAACSGDVTAPDPSLRARASAHQSGAAASDATTTSSTIEPTIVEPVDPYAGDTGAVGSGCCPNR